MKHRFKYNTRIRPMDSKFIAVTMYAYDYLTERYMYHDIPDWEFEDELKTMECELDAAISNS